MVDDWFAVAVEAVECAGRAACQQIEQALGDMAVMKVARSAGVPLADIASDQLARGGRDSRVRAAEAFRAYEQAVAALRGAVVRSLVDDDGLSLSAAGARLGVSRQAASRLYGGPASGSARLAK